MFYGKLASLLSDGDGLRMGLDWKGATSLKPCIKHFNVWKKDCVRTVTNAAKRASFILLPFVACQTQPHRTAGWLSSSLASSTSRVVIVPCFASGTPRRFFGQVTSLSKLTAVLKRHPLEDRLRGHGEVDGVELEPRWHFGIHNFTVERQSNTRPSTLLSAGHCCSGDINVQVT